MPQGLLLRGGICPIRTCLVFACGEFYEKVDKTVHEGLFSQYLCIYQCYFVFIFTWGYFSSKIKSREMLKLPHAEISTFTVFCETQCFYGPGLKDLPGASSNWIICLSVCLSVRNSVPLTKCNI